MAKPTQSLRERNKQKTRRALVDAARRLFLTKGFERTTVDEIAAVAEVSQRTFFRYFPTKEAVVFWEHEARLSRLRLLLERRGSAGGYAPVRAAILEFAGWYAGRRDELLDEYRIVTASPLLLARDVELDTQFEALLAAALGDVEGAPPATRRQARLVSGALFGAVRSILQEWYAGGAVEDLMKLGTEGLALIERGLERLHPPGATA